MFDKRFYYSMIRGELGCAKCVHCVGGDGEPPCPNFRRYIHDTEEEEQCKGFEEKKEGVVQSGEEDNTGNAATAGIV